MGNAPRRRGRALDPTPLFAAPSTSSLVFFDAVYSQTTARTVILKNKTSYSPIAGRHLDTRFTVYDLHYLFLFRYASKWKQYISCSV